MSSWILIEDCTVIDGAGGEPEADSSVLIRDNLVHAVGADATDSSVPRGEDVLRIDGRGKWVMPGMIDSHCHIGFGEIHTSDALDFHTSVELRTLRSAWNVKRVLSSGFTGLSQPGGSYYLGVGLREGLNEGIIEGPRMTSAGKFITTSNGITQDTFPERAGITETAISVLANTSDRMVEEVRRQVANGVDFIKLADSPFGNYQAFSDDEMKILGDLVRRLRKGITIHARGSDEVSAAVDAGFDWIMHGNVMTDETVEKLAKSQIPLVPVLLLIANWAEFGHLVGTPQATIDGCKRLMEHTHETLHRAHKAGVRMAVGTDSGFAITPYGEWGARELELLMTYTGMTSLEAITAATKNGAVTLGLEGQVGEIAPGMLADVLVVDADPVADVRVLQDKSNFHSIIKDGKVVERSKEDDFSRPYDSAYVYSDKELTYDLVNGDGGIARAEHIGAMDRSAEDEVGREEREGLVNGLENGERRAAAEASDQDLGLPGPH